MSSASAQHATDDKKKLPRDPAREVVETVVFVVVLVLLLKLFVTEAFVIPTGSMAETLYGYQKVITCPKCGHAFPINSHDEVEGVAPQNNPNGKKEIVPLTRYVCPNCRHYGLISDLNPRPDNNSGDRVLVLKPLYHIRSPRRGDVVVFKYPQAPQTQQTAQNYIKRAMGFGGETLAVHRGDLFVTSSLTYPDDDPAFARPDDPVDLWKPEYRYRNSTKATSLFAASRAAGFTGAVPGGFQIVRKGEEQMLADLRIVWDNDKQPTDLAGQVKSRWQAAPEGAAQWRADDPRSPRAFGHTGDALDWIRYQHLSAQWKTAPANKIDDTPATDPKVLADQKATYVDNFLGYNIGRSSGAHEQSWVGDLSLECEVELAAGAEVALELSKGADRFRATFGGGKVVLTRSGPRAGELGSKPCKVSAGTYKIRFANVDARLWVWVDGKRIDFGPEADYEPTQLKDTEYDRDDTHKEGWVRANDIDAPANIGARGQVTAIRHIALHRDIYYTWSPPGTQSLPADFNEADIFYVQPGHYFCMGDNSAHSSDSREWGVVPDRLMLGKAVFVFYPVAFDWKLGWPPVRFKAGKNRVGFIK